MNNNYLEKKKEKIKIYNLTLWNLDKLKVKMKNK